MRLSVGILVAGLFGACSVVSCAGADVEIAPDGVGPASITRDLSLGATGPDVAALNRYFAAYGYFPNDELQRSYPAWRPLVPVPPARGDVFDAHTEEATRAFQRTMSLPVTGAVDAATRERLGEERCGVPDGIAAPDPDNKWDLSETGSWGKNNLVWRLINNANVDGDGDNDATDTNIIKNTIRAAANQWASVSAYTFTEWTSGTADIDIRFSTLQDPTIGFATPIGNGTGGDISLDLSNRTWRTSLPVPFGATDLHSIVLHELGHAIGLAHSSIATSAAIPRPVMHPTIATASARRSLRVDDTISGLAMNIGWTQFHGAVIADVAYNIHSGGTSIYVVGLTVGGGGFEIWQLINQATWFRMPGRAAHIAVGATDRPWVVNSAGSIFRWNFAGSWDQVPGCAADVGVGSDDSVWIIGCNEVAGGKSIWKFNGTFPCASVSACWTNVAGGATRISVGPRKPGEPNVPWIVDSAGVIRRRFSGNPASAGWENLPGTAIDIAADSGFAWSIGPQVLPDGLGTIQVWNEQDFGGFGEENGSPPAVKQFRWRTVPGGALRIASAGGMPIVAAAEFGAYWAF